MADAYAIQSSSHPSTYLDNHRSTEGIRETDAGSISGVNTARHKRSTQKNMRDFTPKQPSFNWNASDKYVE